jgi:curli biogenesis system outer membrane secretion channel CsgG
MKKKVMGAVYALLTVFILSACSTEDVTTNNSEPAVSVSTTVKLLTKKEFSEVGTSGLTNPSKDDFCKVHMILTLRGTDYLSDIQGDLPPYKKAFNNIKDDQ